MTLDDILAANSLERDVKDTVYDNSPGLDTEDADYLIDQLMSVLNQFINRPKEPSVIPAEVTESSTIYASALDEIGGPGLAELLLTDDEDPKAVKALKSLKGAKRDEAQWALGWFRGVADFLGKEPIEILRLGRTKNGKRLEVVK